MQYRTAVDSNNVVIAIGIDQMQAGNYNGIGTWSSFTISAIPLMDPDVKTYVFQCQYHKPALKVVSGSVVSRTLLEMQTAYGWNITGASNASPIVITSTAHGLVSGTLVTVTGVAGNTAANVISTPITVTGVDTFSLGGTTGNGIYVTSFGTAVIG